jgi:hypothetical protein
MIKTLVKDYVESTYPDHKYVWCKEVTDKETGYLYLEIICEGNKIVKVNHLELIAFVYSKTTNS